MDDEIDDWLVGLIRVGDERAFGLLFDRYYRRFLGFFLHQGFSRDESRDLIQETFLRVYRGVGGFEGNAPLSSWLLRVAKNVSANEIRSRRAIKRDAPEVSLDAMESEFPGAIDRYGSVDDGLEVAPLEALIAAERTRTLQRAIDGLTVKQQQCLRLQMEQELSMQEISGVLGIAVGTVKATLFQARRKLEKVFQEEPLPDG